MAKAQFRVGGAYTRLAWNQPNTTAGGTNQVTLAYVDVIRETAPRPVAAAQAIQPLDAEYPIEIAFPGALEAGTIEVTFREQWNAEVWNAFYQTYNPIPVNSTLAGGTGVGDKPISDLLGVFKAQLANSANTVTLTKIIVDPTTLNPVRQVLYNSPTIVNIMVDETVNIGTMTFPKSVQFMYLYRTEIYLGNTPGTNPTGSLLQSYNQNVNYPAENPQNAQ